MLIYYNKSTYIVQERRYFKIVSLVILIICVMLASTLTCSHLSVFTEAVPVSVRRMRAPSVVPADSDRASGAVALSARVR